MHIKELFYPEHIEQFWSIPDLVDDEGNARKFSRYLVHSETGDIWSCVSGKFMTLSNNTGGYKQTGIQDDNHQKYVSNHHRFVLAAKLGHWNWDEVGHEDNIRDNNRPDNLSPTTREEQFNEVCRKNMRKSKINRRSNRAKFKDKEIIELREEFELYISNDNGKKTAFYIDRAEKFNVSVMTICNIVNGKLYKDIQVV